MAKKRGAPSKRDAILYAAGHVVLEHGATQLTLDAVAEAAGVSKGGLLYHFPNKDALIEELLALYLRSFDMRIAGHMDADTGGVAGRFLRAYVRTSFSETLPESHFTAAALAAVTARPDLLVRVREKYADWQRNALADGVSQEIALTVMLATDGVWCAELLGIRPLNADQRQMMQNAMLNLLKGSPPA